MGLEPNVLASASPLDHFSNVERGICCMRGNSRENVFAKEALDATECLPMLEEIDREPTLEELNKALNSLASGKVPGKDCIPAEVLKCCKLLPKIGCPPRFLSIIRSIHEDMKRTVAFDGWTPYPFDILSGVKQGCVLAPTLFEIFFTIVQKHAFGSATECIYFRTRSDGRQIPKSSQNVWAISSLPMTRQLPPTQLKAPNNSGTASVRPAETLDLPSVRKKTKVMGQVVDTPSDITISDHELKVVHDFAYLCSTISDTLSLDSERNQRIGKAATTMSWLTKRV